jgi:hypothetical protein
MLMRYLWCVLTCMVYSSATWSAPWLPPVRDGTWLQNGIEQQQRWAAHATLSDQQLNDATIVTTYICAVVDLEKYLVQRAALLAGALQDAKKKQLDRGVGEGMRHAVPILVPLLASDFSAANLSCDKAVQIVRAYLGQYPEMLDKDADEIVEKAMLDAYRKAGENP